MTSTHDADLAALTSLTGHLCVALDSVALTHTMKRFDGTDMTRFEDRHYRHINSGHQTETQPTTPA